MHRMTGACACLHVHFSYSSAHLRLICSTKKTSVIKDLPISKLINIEIHVELICLWHFLNMWILSLLSSFLVFFCSKNGSFSVFVLSSVVSLEKWDIFWLLTANPKLIIHGMFSATTCSNDRATINIRIPCTHIHTNVYIYIFFSLRFLLTSCETKDTENDKNVAKE
jgi:hypothetical protein